MSVDDSLSDIRDAEASSHRSARRIIAVGGGKGGTGKSLVAASVAIYLATLGKKVVLLDGDLGGANLHTFVGVERPAVTLADLVERRVQNIEAAVVETPIAGLGLIAGEGDPSWMASPRPPQRARIISLIQQLKVDYLVIDLSPGTSSTTLDFFLLADLAMIVVQPEPTSVENSVRFLKSAFLRRLRRAGLEHVTAMTREGDHALEGGIPAPLDLYLAAGARAGDSLPPVGLDMQSALLGEMRGFRARLVVNQVRARSDLELGPALASAARRRLGLSVDYLSHLEHDDAVWLAVRKRRPLVIDQPESRAAKGLERLTRRLLALENEKPTPLDVRPLSEISHYEILEVDPGSSDEEIRRGYRRVREVYGTDSLVVPGLYNRERLAALHLRIDEAYETLIDEERRRAYDQAYCPEYQPPRRRGTSPPGVVASTLGERSGPINLAALEDSQSAPAVTSPPAVPLPPEPQITPATEFSGAILRQLRQARGIDLHAISQKTKITVAHLRAIEDEVVKAMPAMVYVRGFLVEYARFLKLDVDRVLATYFNRIKAMKIEGRD